MAAEWLLARSPFFFVRPRPYREAELAAFIHRATAAHPATNRSHEEESMRRAMPGHPSSAATRIRTERRLDDRGRLAYLLATAPDGDS